MNSQSVASIILSQGAGTGPGQQPKTAISMHICLDSLAIQWTDANSPDQFNIPAGVSELPAGTFRRVCPELVEWMTGKLVSAMASGKRGPAFDEQVSEAHRALRLVVDVLDGRAEVEPVGLPFVTRR